MKNLKRLTSVFLCTVLLSFSLAVPASAASTSWDTSDRSQLQGIYKFIQYLTTAPSSYSNGSVIGLLNQILKAQIPNVSTNFRLVGGNGTNDFLNLINNKLQNIYDLQRGDSIAGVLGKIQQNTLAAADRTSNVYTAVTAVNDSITGGNNVLESINDSIGSVSEKVTRLADVLASDADIAIRDAQEANTNIVKDTYLSGSSSGSSLGSSDLKQFSWAGDVLKDSLRLNGQAQVAGFYNGYKSASNDGLGWFSQSTKDALDSVSDSNSISTFSVDSESDPYNMAGFYDNYLWLWGKAK